MQCHCKIFDDKPSPQYIRITGLHLNSTSCNILMIVVSAPSHYKIFMLVLRSLEHISWYFNNASWAVFAVDAIIFCIIKY